MNLEELERLIGTGLLQDGQFGDLIKQHFPDARPVDLYGASVTFNAEGQVASVSCKGRTVKLDAANERAQEKK